SSSRLRSLLTSGDVAAAAALATAAYRVTGVVEPGARRGAGLGFPTANLGRIATLVPAAGVYVARARLADGGPPSAWFPAAVNIGTSPTFETTAPTVEAHLVGFSGDCYGRVLDVDFLERLRDTRRFASVDELKRQLTADVARAAAIASGQPAPARET
ncbi:MAG: bifunctional riboflavin kinase/FAD synthetase, partial [Planctomycetia bacterium]|nr:bifunctional riboflavin kinase/FAD synthetase [Planctomycetia bacterium]